MNPLKSLLASALIALPVTVFVIPLAHADVIYTYTGNDFTSVNGTTFTTSDFITVTLDYASAPPPNSMSTTSPKTWTFAAGPLTLSSTTTGLHLYYPTIEVDAAGAVTQWHLEAETLGEYILTANQNGVAEDEVDTQIIYGTGTTYGHNYQDPGTWTVAGLPVPEPSSFALLGAGLASLFTWLVWGKRQRRTG